MMTVQQRTTDWWLWQMYRQVADFIHQPNQENARRLQILMDQYRAGRSEFDAEDSATQPAKCG